MKNRDRMLHDMAQQKLATGEALGPDQFPHLYNLSGAFFYDFLPVPSERPEPEYVFMPVRRDRRRMEVMGALATYNMAWESGQLRAHWMAQEEQWPRELDWLRTASETVDLRIVPLENRLRYPAYAPLYHLLPLATVKRFGLPALKAATWPSHSQMAPMELVLPADFNERLSAAFSYHVWRHLPGGGDRSAFSSVEPLRILSHNLDFWLPHIDQVIQRRLGQNRRCEPDDAKQAARLKKLRKHVPRGVRVERPLQGGDVWQGEEDALDATLHMVELADAGGRLRSLVDAVRSNRLDDDFSDRWSFAKEDFERRLYRKRAKTRVTFVELNETVPVYSPESEVHERLLWEDFLAFLDEKERRVVVCLRSGLTRVGEIAEHLGYANHSPVSKALRRIQQKAIRYLELG